MEYLGTGDEAFQKPAPNTNVHSCRIGITRQTAFWTGRGAGRGGGGPFSLAQTMLQHVFPSSRPKPSRPPGNSSNRMSSISQIGFIIASPPSLICGACACFFGREGGPVPRHGTSYTGTCVNTRAKDKESPTTLSPFRLCCLQAYPLQSQSKTRGTSHMTPSTTQPRHKPTVCVDHQLHRLLLTLITGLFLVLWLFARMAC